MNLVDFLERQEAFSRKAFGPGPRVGGVLEHIALESAEVIEAHAHGRPTLPEWVDLILLALDGAWRSGASAEAIAVALEAKLARNERRTWPDWRTGSQDHAIQHIEEC